ncbi:hypothetical protein BJ138DRAFT_1072065, partial [Hygrophoropsis aurantiaca]
MGHSWGGMLAADYASSRPSSTRHTRAECAALKEQSMHQLPVLEGFPEDFRTVLHSMRGKARRQIRSTRTRTACTSSTMPGTHRACTTKPWPQELIDSFAIVQ